MYRCDLSPRRAKIVVMVAQESCLLNCRRQSGKVLGSVDTVPQMWHLFCLGCFIFYVSCIACLRRQDTGQELVDRMQLARQEQEVGTVKMIEDVQRTGESNGRKDSGAPARSSFGGKMSWEINWLEAHRDRHRAKKKIAAQAWMTVTASGRRQNGLRWWACCLWWPLQLVASCCFCFTATITASTRPTTSGQRQWTGRLQSAGATDISAAISLSNLEYIIASVSLLLQLCLAWLKPCMGRWNSRPSDSELFIHTVYTCLYYQRMPPLSCIKHPGPLPKARNTTVPGGNLEAQFPITCP